MILPIWDLGDTYREFNIERIEPSTISIHKWESFASVLANITERVGQACGLCLEKDRLEYSCSECPVAILDEICSHNGSLLKRFSIKISEARQLAHELIDTLREIEAKRLKKKANSYLNSTSYLK